MAASDAPTAPWRQWGPYLSARQWGTVREDYSADGEAWQHLTYDDARSRAYRWGEDGIGGICDRWQHLCFALTVWNGRDATLKERLFGLANGEGNHGEDAKEYWWHLDATPTSSYLHFRYRYPHAAFPYDDLIATNAARGLADAEYELLDTGVFDEDRYFDIDVIYAKATATDMCIEIRVRNAGPEPATIHLLPTLWFRNTWAWGRDDRRPRLSAVDDRTLLAEHATLGSYWLSSQPGGELLFTDNETNVMRLYGTPNPSRYVKDGINDHVVHGADTVNPDRVGTKASVWYSLEVAAGETTQVRLRLADTEPSASGLADEHRSVIELRSQQADRFYATAVPPGTPDEARRVQRLALAGLLWTRKHYRYDVRTWLEGDPAQPPPPQARATGRNNRWTHLYNADIISMPDEWEYPWYAAWDLAFHTVPLCVVDPAFAKHQLLLLCREWYMHPDGQLPSYEWSFDDVSPPVHAWAVWRVYKISAAVTGHRDREFLARAFHKLMLYFSWWVNRRDAQGSNLFQGGFLGLDNIGLFDRSGPLPAGGRLEQADATSWMALFCLNMFAIALELARVDRAYEDVATKFFEHFLGIASATTESAHGGISLWDDETGFYYDVLQTDDGALRLPVRSLVGLIPLFAVETIEATVFDELPDFARRVSWFVRKRSDIARNVFTADVPGMGERRMLSLLNPDQLRRVLQRVFDESEFLSPYGVRSLSAQYRDRPVHLDLDGSDHVVAYEPGDSQTHMFGGNSNWRGPVWMPVNFLLLESLQRYHHYFGDAFTIEVPTGSGRHLTLAEAADELGRRLIHLFLPDDNGVRPVHGDNPRLHVAGWRETVTFNEYFHGDTGAGLGASHQTGWTALIAKLIRQLGPDLDG
ncbi:MAG: hypothetical protein QOG53_3400 [Frankiales bacterium]|nr:hypothetical protein [Frankiales bacterium]